MYAALEEGLVEWWDLCTSQGYGAYQCSGQAAPGAAGTLAGAMGLATKATTTAVKVLDKVIPSKATDTLDYKKSHNGSPPPGYKGSSTFDNDGRSGTMKLPETDANGNPITYNV